MPYLRLLVALGVLLTLQLPVARAQQLDGPTVVRQTHDDFRAGRFDLLEAAAQRYRADKSVSPSGNRLLGSFYDALRNTRGIYGVQDFRAVENQRKQIGAWLTAYPRSGTAKLALADLEITHGWLIRGTGMAASVSTPQWEGFYRQLKRAYDQLLEIEDFAADDPQWRATMLQIATAHGAPDAVFDWLATQALDQDASFAPTRSAILRRRLPEWGGSWEAYDQAIDDMTARTAASHGQAIYALSYWDLADTRFGDHIFKQSLAKWPRMRQGFQDLVARYPSDVNLNAFGAFACLARDLETLRPILARLQGRMNAAQWKKKADMKGCVYAADRERIDAEDAAHYAKPRPIPAERLERAEVTAAASADFIAGRFAQLDAAHASYLAGRSRTSSGAWKLEFFYDGLAPMEMIYAPGAPVDQPTFEKVEAQTDAWVAASPRSIPASVAKARILLARARMLRFGTAFANKPTDERTAGAFSAIAAARRTLERSRAWSASDPDWWATLITAAHAEGQDGEAQDAIAREALALGPERYQRVVSAILSRAWIPSPKERFADMAKLIETAAADAPQAYAEAVLWLSSVNHRPDLVDSANLDWASAKTGLDLILARYPSDWNLNAYANLACMAKDRATARLLFARIEDRVVEYLWTDWRAPKTCREWADANGG